MVEQKRCYSCEEYFPATLEYFGKHSSSKDGLRGQCKVCKAKKAKEYRKEHKEQRAAYNKQYNSEHKEIINRIKNKYRNKYRKEHPNIVSMKAKIYYLKHKDDVLERSRVYRINNSAIISECSRNYRLKNIDRLNKYYEENKERISIRGKKYRLNNKDKINEQRREYYKNNKEKVCNKVHRHNAKKKSLPHTLTTKQWKEIKFKFNNSCAYCGGGYSMTQDHFIPLSKDGEYTRDNIIPACKKCNCSKNDNNPFTWYPMQKFYSEEKWQKILKHLGYNSFLHQQLSFA